MLTARNILPVISSAIAVLHVLNFQILSRYYPCSERESGSYSIPPVRRQKPCRLPSMFATSNELTEQVMYYFIILAADFNSMLFTTTIFKNIMAYKYIY